MLVTRGGGKGVGRVVRGTVILAVLVVIPRGPFKARLEKRKQSWGMEKGGGGCNSVFHTTHWMPFLAQFVLVMGIPVGLGRRENSRILNMLGKRKRSY